MTLEATDDMIELLDACLEVSWAYNSIWLFLHRSYSIRLYLTVGFSDRLMVSGQIYKKSNLKVYE